MTARVGILLSGRGSNFIALHDATLRGELDAEVSLVVSNVPEAVGLARARERGLSTFALSHREAASREEHEKRILAELERARVEWICLAGYMRLLSPSFVAARGSRILNIHPSLLPAFPGLHPQRQALEAGVKVSGCTVHLVDEGLDSGPIVAQRSVPVTDEDTEETLAARILVAEHLCYPMALQQLLKRAWSIEGRRLKFAG